jgi:hypothetical protein
MEARERSPNQGQGNIFAKKELVTYRQTVGRRSFSGRGICITDFLGVCQLLALAELFMR